MDGHIAPMAEICDLAEHLRRDDLSRRGPRRRHVRPARRRRCGAHDGQMGRIDIINGTLAKGFGVMGGYIAASTRLL